MDRDDLARGMAMVEIAVQDMAEMGMTPIQIVVAPAWHLNQQAAIALPNRTGRNIWKASLLGLPGARIPPHPDTPDA